MCEGKTNASDSDPSTLIVLNEVSSKDIISLYQKYPKTKVFGDLLSAIYQAYLNATPYNNSEVEILMETGVHYITAEDITNFEILKLVNPTADFKNSRLSLTIKPIQCDNQEFSTPNCLKSTSSKVTIRNKAGSRLRF